MIHLKRYQKLISIVLLLAAGIGVYVLFFTNGEEATYITEPVRRQRVEKVVNATGEVRAMELVTVGAQASGKIEKLLVAIGQAVKAGDLVAEIDSTTQQNEVNMNKAKLASYEAQLAAAQVSLSVAQKQYARIAVLQQADAASAEELEDLQDAYETAKAKVAELEALLEETKISLSTAETNLGYTKITAPLDGTIVSVPVKQGQTVNAAMNTPTIVQIADLSHMEILLEISEGDIEDVQPGIRVTYSVLSDLNTTHETTLASIDPGLTLLTRGEYTEVVGSSEAIYYYGRLVVPNAEGRLRIGMTTQSVLHVAEADDVLTVPSIAIKGVAAEKYVEVLTAGHEVQRRTIRTGITDGLHVVVESGVAEGDEVVIARLSTAEISDKTAQGGPPRRM